MIQVTIGEETRSIAEATEQWINQQIVRRRRDGGPLCVQVNIKRPPLTMLLTTPQCGSSLSGGGYRPPNDHECRILDLWNQRGLNRHEFTGGNLVAFLKQLTA